MPEVRKTAQQSNSRWLGKLSQGITSLAKVPVQAVKSATRMPVHAAMQAKAAARALGPAWQAVAHKAASLTVPAPTARGRQVQADQAFFAAHRQQIATGTVWAGRGQDGSLHLMPHSPAAAEMFRAVDRSVRVEKGADSLEYLKGEGEGAVDAARDAKNAVVAVSYAVAHPVKAFQAAHKAGAGRALVDFSRNSTEIVARTLDEAHKNPRSAGRFMGRLVGDLAVQALLLKGAGRVAQRILKAAEPVAETAAEQIVAPRSTPSETAVEAIPTRSERVAASPIEVTSYPDRTAARAALSGKQQAAANRFFKKGTGKSQDFKVIALDDGTYRLEFFSPARNAGYGKLFVQLIGPEGEIIQRFKDTMGPEGLIERKWLPIEEESVINGI